MDETPDTVQAARVRSWGAWTMEARRTRQEASSRNDLITEPWILVRVRWGETSASWLHPPEIRRKKSSLFLGRGLRLRIDHNDCPAGVTVERGRVALPDHSGAPTDRRKSVRSLVERWNHVRAAKRLPKRGAMWAKRHEVHRIGGVPARGQQRLRVNCDAAGTLWFNGRVVQDATRLVDYFAHGLIHLVTWDHPPDFWSRRGETLVDFKQRREALRWLGPRLER